MGPARPGLDSSQLLHKSPIGSIWPKRCHHHFLLATNSERWRMKQLCHPRSNERRGTPASRWTGERAPSWAVYAAVMVCVRALEIITRRAMMVRLLPDSLARNLMHTQTLGIRKSQGTSAVGQSVSCFYTFPHLLQAIFLCRTPAPCTVVLLSSWWLLSGNHCA